MVEDKELDNYKVYTISGGATERRYPSYDLGLLKGGKQPFSVKRLDTDTTPVEDKGTFTDVTEDARSLTSSTFTAIRASGKLYDALYVGFTDPFTGIRPNINTAGIDAGALAADWEYPIENYTDGTPKTWHSLNADDGSTDLTSGTGNKDVKWIEPTDWIKTIIDGVEAYWIKLMVSTVGYSTAPVLESILIVTSQPALSITVMNSVDDDCDLHVNSTITAGSITDKDAIPIASGQGIKEEEPIDKDNIYNFALKNLAGGKTAIIHCGMMRFTQEPVGYSTSSPSYTAITDPDTGYTADVIVSTYTEDGGIAKGTQTNSTLQDTDKSWGVDALQGMTIIIHTESQNEESAIVASNTADTITISGTWANNPVTGVTHYEVRTEGKAVLVKMSEITIDADEVNISDIKAFQYKSSPPTLKNNQDVQAIVDSKGRIITVGAAADGSAVTGSPVLMGGQDGTNVESIKTDSTGRQEVIGGAADGSPVAGNPVLIAGQDGANAQSLLTDASGQLELAHDVNTNPIFAKITDGTDESTVFQLTATTDNIDGEYGLVSAAGLFARVDDDNLLPVGLIDTIYSLKSDLSSVAGTATDVNSGNKSAGSQRVVIATDDINLAAIKVSAEILDDIVLEEDTAHGSGDKGVMALVVRKDTGGTLVDTDGDYAPLQVTSVGDLRTTLDGETVTTDEVVPSTLLSGTKNVATAGSPETLTATSVSAKVVVIKAKRTNTGFVKVGSSGNEDFELDATDTVAIPIDDLQKIYLDVTVNGEGVQYLGSV